MVADHKHVEMLVQGVVGEGSRWVRGRGKDVVLAANNDDVRSVTSSSSLGVVAVRKNKSFRLAYDEMTISCRAEVREREEREGKRGERTNVWMVRPLKAAMVLSTNPDSFKVSV